MNALSWVIFGFEHELAFIKLGEDTWTKTNPYCGPFEDILHYKNQFYAINWQGALIFLDVTKSKDSTRKIVVSETCSEFLNWILTKKRESGVEIESLGDVALFLGDNSSISVLVSNFVGCQPNCIYFTHDEDAKLVPENPYDSDLGVYEVEIKSFKLYYTIVSADVHITAGRPPIWVVPRVNLY
ncbi:hypothetical protein PanWU01x14_075730 [Parasponia andersonii]|uniref:KIB1-4 beta-propeller domain-containing protein n=1 Tax=Parasponia andersonii TaxID=3476 RepID=A0A2P5DCW6_PARAD|nr:hypothetical protein PanWU01x14_075730 [Parasponia andersonii]